MPAFAGMTVDKNHSSLRGAHRATKQSSLWTHWIASPSSRACRGTLAMTMERFKSENGQRFSPLAVSFVAT
jgi:hypothetical protein